MLENLNENEAKNLLLTLVKEYHHKFHKKDNDFKVGDKIPYSSRVYDENELMNLVDSSLEFWLTEGRYTKKFEQSLSKYLELPFVSFVNSGSSANLIAFMSLTSPLLGDRAVKRGDEVITVAAGFPTTVSPIIQFGAIPVFVDVTIPQYNIDVTMLENAVSEKTKAVMVAHTLGNPFDIDEVKSFCKKHDLWLIEDNCDALGSQYISNGEKKLTGTFGDISTSSFYPAHHITTGEGGAVYTKNPLLNKIIRSLRDWGRDCICPPGKDNTCNHRFDRKFSLLPLGYDHKYVYSHFGYNLKATDMQAAIGCAQLEKLPFFTKRRRENFDLLYERLLPLSEKIILPKPNIKSVPSWFGFIITCKEGIDKSKVVNYLEQNKIQTRSLFSGNLLKHPCFDEMRNSGSGYRKIGNLENTDLVMKNTFWVGVYPGITEKMIDHISNTIQFIL